MQERPFADIAMKPMIWGNLVPKNPSLGPGPWLEEPDRFQWRHASGLACLLIRMTRGHLCGYVGLPPGHPLSFNRSCDDDLPCHGGISYSQRNENPMLRLDMMDVFLWDGHDRFVPGLYWLGFDAGHAYDYQPYDLASVGSMPRSAYRAMPFMIEQTDALASALSRLAQEHGEKLSRASAGAPGRARHRLSAVEF